MIIGKVTKQQREEMAQEELRKKLSLENNIINQFDSIFRKLALQVEESYIQNQQSPDLSEFNKEIINILRNDTNLIGTQFKTELTLDEIEGSNLQKSIQNAAKINGISEQEMLNIINSNMETGSDLLLMNTANNNANFINVTNFESIEEAIDKAEDEGISGTTPLAIAGIGSLAASLFLAEALRRSKTIAATVTEQAAEGIKSSEENTLKNTLADDGQLPESKDFWETVGDDRVRDAHAEADGQVRGSESPNGTFLVGGEILRYPGDPQGSPENIINCRCSLVSVFN